MSAPDLPLCRGIFDTHAHYDDEKFENDRDELLSGITRPCDANPLGIEYIVNCASDIATAEKCIALAKKYRFIKAAVGVHPHEADSFTDKTADEIRKMLDDPVTVAVGEIGLDYHYDFSPRDVQKRVFEAQLDICGETSYPAIIHDREAHGDVMDILRRHRNVRVVLHSFSGSGEMVKELVNMGHYISYSGSVTFKGAVNLCESVKHVPLDRLLVETDSPYLSPVPYRGKRNDSRNIYATLSKLSEILDIPSERLAVITSDNAKRFFGIEK